MTARPQLGPAAEAERNRQLIRAQATAPRRSTKDQEDPTTLPLFGQAEPELFA